MYIMVETGKSDIAQDSLEGRIEGLVNALNSTPQFVDSRSGEPTSFDLTDNTITSSDYTDMADILLEKSLSASGNSVEYINGLKHKKLKENCLVNVVENAPYPDSARAMRYLFEDQMSEGGIDSEQFAGDNLLCFVMSRSDLVLEAVNLIKRFKTPKIKLEKLYECYINANDGLKLDIAQHINESIDTFLIRQIPSREYVERLCLLIANDVGGEAGEKVVDYFVTLLRPESLTKIILAEGKSRDYAFKELLTYQNSNSRVTELRKLKNTPYATLAVDGIAETIANTRVHALFDFAMESNAQLLALERLVGLINGMNNNEIYDLLCRAAKEGDGVIPTKAVEYITQIPDEGRRWDGLKEIVQCDESGKNAVREVVRYLTELTDLNEKAGKLSSIYDNECNPFAREAIKHYLVNHVDEFAGVTNPNLKEKIMSIVAIEGSDAAALRALGYIGEIKEEKIKRLALENVVKGASYERARIAVNLLSNLRPLLRNQALVGCATWDSYSALNGQERELKDHVIEKIAHIDPEKDRINGLLEVIGCGEDVRTRYKAWSYLPKGMKAQKSFEVVFHS